MFVREIKEWMDLIILEWKGLNMMKSYCIFMWQRHQGKNKGASQFVEFVQLNIMCVAYIHHFAIYSKDKTKVTQLIPSMVWKVVYTTYKNDYPVSKLQQKKTLNFFILETLRELKIGTSNRQGLKRVVLQNEEVKFDFYNLQTTINDEFDQSIKN